MRTVEGGITKEREIICYNLRGVMEICRLSRQPKTNALIDCIYHSQAHCCRAPIPRWCTPLPYICDIFWHFMTHLDAFRLFWHILRYIYFGLDKTGPNICNGDDVKMVTSDLSARINDVLRYVGITRNMNAYIILSHDADCRGRRPPASRGKRGLHAHCRQEAVRAQSSPEHDPPGIQGCMGSLPRACSGAGWLSSEWSPFCRDHARAAL